MARYTGPRAKKARALGEPIFGFMLQDSMEIPEEKSKGLTMVYNWKKSKKQNTHMAF